jgi:biotin carboxyl carrier protein
MGKIYRIRVDSEVYEVEIDEVLKGSVYKATKEVKPEEKKVVETIKDKSIPQQTQPLEKVDEKKEETVEPVENNAEYILAPLPGKVLKVMVNPGDSVKKGDVLLTIEAMKMENEIFAGFDAKVADVYVKPGDKVETNKKLIKLVR